MLWNRQCSEHTKYSAVDQKFNNAKNSYGNEQADSRIETRDVDRTLLHTAYFQAWDFLTQRSKSSHNAAHCAMQSIGITAPTGRAWSTKPSGRRCSVCSRFRCLASPAATRGCQVAFQGFAYAAETRVPTRSMANGRCDAALQGWCTRKGMLFATLVDNGA